MFFGLKICKEGGGGRGWNLSNLPGATSLIEKNFWNNPEKIQKKSGNHTELGK